MPPRKRKLEEDFVFTLSDIEDDSVDALADKAAAEKPVPKKPKKSTSRPKAAGKSAGEESHSTIMPKDAVRESDDDEGAMNPDFQFFDQDAGRLDEDDFAGWGFDGAERESASSKKPVDLDGIIRRQRDKQLSNQSVAEAGDTGSHLDLNMDDGGDEVLADDAFGMSLVPDSPASSNDNIDHQRASESLNDNDAASDDDSVATPVSHPDDQISDSSDQESDAGEQAKRDAFFAPPKAPKTGKAVDSSSFFSMSLSRPTMRGLSAVGFAKPTPIQSQAIPIALMGHDIVGSAVTGSGKTGAFMIPILQRLLFRPTKTPMTRVVVLTPTRELAIQLHHVAVKLASHTDITFALAVGGLSVKVQEAELRRRPDIIIATPGRFIDHMKNAASFNIDAVEILVLDEADRMLQDGFAEELDEILNTLPKSRQTMLFSATMTSKVDRLIQIGLRKPARVMADAPRQTVGTLEQLFVRLRPGREEKRMGYLIHLCSTLYTQRVIVFFAQKTEVHRARIVFGLLGLPCAELHGNMSQAQRIASVESFRDGNVSFLLATDLASRGLDIKGVDTVINHDAPRDTEVYLHRVGRTARAGRRGTSVTLAAEPDRKLVKAVRKLARGQGGDVRGCQISAEEADKWQDRVDQMQDEIKTVLQEEKEERQLAQAQMQITKGENLIEHEAEIKSRPKRTWIDKGRTARSKPAPTANDKVDAMRQSLKSKASGKLSNKDKKRLDARATQLEGGLWKKGKSAAGPAAAKTKPRGASKSKAKAKGGARSKGPRGKR